MPRPPEPTASKVARGNPGRRPMKPDATAFFPDGPPRQMVEFTDGSQAAFELMQSELAKVEGEFTTPLDGYFLTLMAMLWQEIIDADREIKAIGRVVETSNNEGKTIMVRQNPEVKCRNESIALFIKLATQFGMSPSARVGLAPYGQPKADDDEFGELLAGRSKPSMN